MWVFIESEKGTVWTVGFYTPTGEWVPESDWSNPSEARARCHYLNGGEADARPS